MNSHGSINQLHRLSRFCVNLIYPLHPSLCFSPMLGYIKVNPRHQISSSTNDSVCITKSLKNIIMAPSLLLKLKNDSLISSNRQRGSNFPDWQKNSSHNRFGLNMPIYCIYLISKFHLTSDNFSQSLTPLLHLTCNFLLKKLGQLSSRFFHVLDLMDITYFFVFHIHYKLVTELEVWSDSHSTLR